MTWVKNQMERSYYIYMMANARNTTVYTGVTKNLRKRAFEHREKLADGFTKKYNLNKLVYYEIFGDAKEAIAREKQIKGGSRLDKEKLIKAMNPDWEDLYGKL